MTLNGFMKLKNNLLWKCEKQTQSFWSKIAYGSNEIKIISCTSFMSMFDFHDTRKKEEGATSRDNNRNRKPGLTNEKRSVNKKLSQNHETKFL